MNYHDIHTKRDTGPPSMNQFQVIIPQTHKKRNKSGVQLPDVLTIRLRNEE